MNKVRIEVNEDGETIVKLNGQIIAEVLGVAQEFPTIGSGPNTVTITFAGEPVEYVSDPDGRKAAVQQLVHDNEVVMAYEEGKVIRYRRKFSQDDWIEAQRVACKHAFDFDRYEYTIAKGK
jgi:hypothetical protein